MRHFKSTSVHAVNSLSSWRGSSEANSWHSRRRRTCSARRTHFPSWSRPGGRTVHRTHRPADPRNLPGTRPCHPGRIRRKSSICRQLNTICNSDSGWLSGRRLAAGRSAASRLKTACPSPWPSIPCRWSRREPSRANKRCSRTCWTKRPVVDSPMLGHLYYRFSHQQLKKKTATFRNLLGRRGLLAVSRRFGASAATPPRERERKYLMGEQLQ